MANDPAYPHPSDRSPTARVQREECWRQRVARWRKSGLTQAAFGAREGIKPWDLSRWIHQLGLEEGKRPARTCDDEVPRRKRPAAFVPVRVVEAAPLADPILVEVVIRSGHVLRLPPGFDPATLRRAVETLEGPPC